MGSENCLPVCESVQDRAGNLGVQSVSECCSIPQGEELRGNWKGRMSITVPFAIDQEVRKKRREVEEKEKEEALNGVFKLPSVPKAGQTGTEAPAYGSSPWGLNS